MQSSLKMPISSNALYLWKGLHLNKNFVSREVHSIPFEPDSEDTDAISFV